jgi:adenylate kinase family enzyme
MQSRQCECAPLHARIAFVPLNGAFHGMLRRKPVPGGQQNLPITRFGVDHPLPPANYLSRPAARLSQSESRRALGAVAVPGQESPFGAFPMTCTQSLRILFLLGAPGAGKSTLAKKLSELHNWRHLNVGDLLREAASGTSPLVTADQSRELENLLLVGDRIAPSEITATLLNSALERCWSTSTSSDQRTVIVDGFPRNHENWQAFETSVQRTLTAYPCFVLLWLDLPFSVALRRAQQRHRNDDLTPTLKRRFKVYVQETLPLRQRLPADRQYCVSADQPVDHIVTSVQRLLREAGFLASNWSSCP